MDRWNPIRQGASDVLVVPRSALLPNDPASVDCLIEDALGHPEGRAAFAAWLGVSEDQLEQPEVRAAARRLLTQGHWQAIEVGRTEPPRGSVFDVPVPVPEPTGPVLRRKKIGSDTAQPAVASRDDLRATIVSLDGWWATQKVMVFQSARQTTWGPVTVRGILRRALCTPVGGEVHIIGHADTVGAAADNDALALERARSLHFYLSGDRAGWAEHALAQADVATMQAALRWIGLHSSIACDPGPVDGDWGPVTGASLAALRAAADLEDAGPPNADDWAAIYDAFDEGLAAIMLTDRAGLAVARARIQAIDPASKGETFPADAPALDGHDSLANRRVDVVFCAAGSIPNASTDEIYNGAFTVEHVAVGPECEFELLVTDPKLRPIGGGVVFADVGPLGVRRMTADVSGVVRATVLRGERIRVMRATDSGGSGNVVNHGLRESIGPEGGAP